MLIIYHNGSKLVEVCNSNASENAIHHNFEISISECIVLIAQEFPNEVIVWCHELLKSQLNILEIDTLFHHRKLLFSYNPTGDACFDKSIGYLERAPFMKINSKVTFPTWQMSSWVGAIHSEVVLAFKKQIPLDTDFEYFLCSMAKLGFPKGLLCYSEPRFLKQLIEVTSIKKSSYTLFRFVKQHYKTRWVFILLFNMLVYERKIPILPLFFSLFYKNRMRTNVNLDNIMVKSSKKVLDKKTVDVIIPTIGRKNYLYDILEDLKGQTHLPSNVIIVEQNPDKTSESDLIYISNEEWPYSIKHSFTHQTGVCNARNIALAQRTSEWIFFADDDIRIEPDFIEKALKKVNDYGVQAASFRCFQKGQKPSFTNVFQWETFGAGSSFVFAESLNNCKFKLGFEFGFAEDGDFGMQLRNQGVDILYLIEPSVLHLKAPMGGFRTKPLLRWQNETIQPKPAPTILLYKMIHDTKEQIRGYKLFLFLKYYKHQTIRNPFRYYTYFQKQWKSSVFWANELKKQNEV